MRYVFMTSKPETAMGVGPWMNRIYGGHVWTSNTAAYRYVTIPCAGTFQHFMFRVSAAPGAAKTWTINLYVDGVTTALGVTISGASQTVGLDFKNKVHVNPGAKVCLSGSGTAGTTLGYGYWTVDFISDKPNEWPIVGGWTGGFLYTGLAWAPIMGGNSQMQSSASAARKLLTITYSPISGKITNWYVNFDAAPGVGASWTLTLYKNGAATSMVVTISGAATSGSDTDPTHAVTVAQGDTLQWYSSASAAPAPASAYPNWGFTFVSDNPGWWFISAPNDDLLDITSTTEYLKPYGGSTNVWTATEANTYMYSPNAPNRPFYMKNMYASVNTAPGAGKNWTFTIRQNAGSPTNGLSAAVADANLLATDLTHQILINPNMPLDIMETNNSPATARYLQFSAACWTPPEENQNLYKPTLHADHGLGLKRHPRSRIY